MVERVAEVIEESAGVVDTDSVGARVVVIAADVVEDSAGIVDYVDSVAIAAIVVIAIDVV